MNRLFTLLAVALTISLSSCMKSPKYEPSPVQGGLNIYSFVGNTQTIATDPINVAIRLNILLHEASLQPTSPLGKIIVKDGANKEYNVKERLFGNSVIETVEPGTYSITYQLSYESRNDFSNRRGTFIIETSSKTLYEDDARWTISMGNGSTDNNTKPYLYGGNTGNIYYGESSYHLAYNGNGMISAEGLYEGYVTEAGKANWQVDTNITLESAKTFLEIVNSKGIAVSHNSSGTILGGQTISSPSSFVTITDLIYKPSCGWNNMIAGAIGVSFPEIKITAPQDYPSDYVKIAWTAGADCKSSIVVSYNGFDLPY